MSIAERPITTPVNQHAVPALRPSSVIVSCVCVSRACACMRDLDRISPGEHRRSGSGVARVQTSFNLSPNPNLIPNPQSANYSVQAGQLSRQSSSRLRRESTGFSASSLLTEKRRLPVAAGAARLAAGSAHVLAQDVVHPHLASAGRPRRCRSSSRQIGVRRSHTLRRGRRIRAGSDPPGRPCESQAPGPCWPSRAS